MKKLMLRTVCIALCMLSAVVAVFAASQELHLLVLSELEERIAGKMAFSTLEQRLAERGMLIAPDPRVTAIGQAVAEYSDRPQLHYSFHVIEGDVLEPQALSLPGGYVLISRTLLEQVCRTDDDIAFVIGHEIAHSALRHYADYKLQDDQQVAYIRQLLQQNTTLFGENVAPQDSAELHDLLFPYILKIRQIKEMEADQFGALYALRAGYNFSAGMRVLARLREMFGETFQLEQDPLQPDAESQLASSSHPLLSDRIEQLELFRLKAVEVARLFPPGRDALDRGNYQEASLIFETILSLFPQSRTAHIGLGVTRHLQYWNSTPGDDFLLAYPGNLEIEYMYLIQRVPHDFQVLQQAIDEYRLVLSEEPGNMYAANNLGVALAEMNRQEEAEQVLREALRLKNKDFILFNLALILCQTYQETQEAHIKEEAVALLEDYLELTPHDQVAMQYLQQLQ